MTFAQEICTGLSYRKVTALEEAQIAENEDDSVLKPVGFLLSNICHGCNKRMSATPTGGANH